MGKLSPIKQYNLSLPKYQEFTSLIEDLLRKLLNSEGINIHLVESRTKTVESFQEKIDRKKDQYKNPLSEITDICGQSIINLTIM